MLGCVRPDASPRAPVDRLSAISTVVRGAVSSRTPGAYGLLAAGAAGPKFWFADLRSRDLWEIDFASPAEPFRRVADLQTFGLGNAVALGGGSDALVLDQTGLLMAVSSRSTIEPRGRVSVVAGARPMSLIPTPTGIILALEVVTGGRAGRTADSLLFLGISGSRDSLRLSRLLSVGRADIEHARAFVSDITSASGFGDTLVLTGADPARVTIFIKTGAALVRAQWDTLRHPPQRSIPESERDRMRRRITASRSPLAKGAEIPSSYPPVAAALPIRNGWVVVAVSGEDSQSVDAYCEGALSQTLYDGAPGARAYVTPAGLVLMTETDGGLRAMLVTRRALDQLCVNVR